MCNIWRKRLRPGWHSEPAETQEILSGCAVNRNLARLVCAKFHHHGTSLSASTPVGNYLIAGPLGKGGMGQVFRGNDSKLECDAAIKVPPAAFAWPSDAGPQAFSSREPASITSKPPPLQTLPVVPRRGQ